MLIIAKQNEETVSIKDAKKGEDYECFCCGSKLITKQGKVKTWHFAHANGEDCAGGSETQLHILAKQYFENNTELNVYGQKPMILNITNAQLEQRYLNVIPDVTAEIDGQKVFIEIVVTSKITEEKATKLESYGIPVIIIDLKKFYKILFEVEELYNYIALKTFMYYDFIEWEKHFEKSILEDIQSLKNRIRNHLFEKENKLNKLLNWKSIAFQKWKKEGVWEECSDFLAPFHVGGHLFFDTNNWRIDEFIVENEMDIEIDFQYVCVNKINFLNTFIGRLHDNYKVEDLSFFGYIFNCEGSEMRFSGELYSRLVQCYDYINDLQHEYAKNRIKEVTETYNKWVAEQKLNFEYDRQKTITETWEKINELKNEKISHFNYIKGFLTKFE